MTQQKTLKEKSINKNYYDDNYSAPFACRSFAFDIYYLPLCESPNHGNLQEQVQVSSSKLPSLAQTFKHGGPKRLGCEWTTCHPSWFPAMDDIVQPFSNIVAFGSL